MEDSAQEILNSLEPLFYRAEKEKLWFFCRYRQLWFSPKELRARHLEGRFIWGACNWELRDPVSCVYRLKKDIEEAEQALINWVRRMKDE